VQPSFQLCELFLGGPAVPSRLARPSRGCCSANPILSLAGLGHVVPNECRTSVALGWWDGGELVRENFGATIRLRCRLVPCCLGSRFSRRAIRSSPGGEVLSYLSLLELVRKSGERVIIDGPCLSACTLVLSVVPGNRICVTRKAVLGFHAAIAVDRHGRQYSASEATRVIAETYPAPVRAWIGRHGGLSRRVLLLRGRELTAMYPSCS